MMSCIINMISVLVPHTLYTIDTYFNLVLIILLLTTQSQTHLHRFVTLPSLLCHPHPSSPLQQTREQMGKIDDVDMRMQRAGEKQITANARMKSLAKSS